LGQVVHVEILDPWHELAAAGEFAEIEDLSPIGTTYLEIPLRFLGFPTGQWRAVVSWSGTVVERQFEVSAPEFPMLAIERGSSPRILGVRWDVMRGHLFSYGEPFSTGETVWFFGAGLPAQRSLPLGIYRFTANGMEEFHVVSRQGVTTDAEGKFATSFVLDASYVPDYYAAAVVVDPAYQPADPETRSLGAWIPFSISEN
jgi:hypothetical protein